MPSPRLLLPALHTSSRRACARGWACVPLDGGSDGWRKEDGVGSGGAGREVQVEMEAGVAEPKVLEEEDEGRFLAIRL